MRGTTLFLGALACATSALGHMELAWPYAFRSKWNPANSPASGNIDYSMTSPLGAYPCKGYIDSSAPSVASWAAGSSVNYTIAGSAIHGGGSCQISLSYDQGKTWNVIFSHIGGCLIEGLTEDITIPKEAPSGEAIFSWSWFNLLGNREMYQNCAPVTITNGGSGLDSASFPAPFIANVDVAPNCHTIEGTEVVFPNPGKNVKYGGKYAGTTPKAGAGITGDCAVSSSGGGGSNTIPSSSSSAQAAGETLFTPSSSSAQSSTSAITNALPSGNANHNAPVPSIPASASVTSSSAGSATVTGVKKCKRRAPSSRGMERRHERLVRRSKHDHLVRRKVGKYQLID